MTTSQDRKEAQTEAREWQDISTAPKDGRKILVWADGYEWPEIIYFEEYDFETAADIGEPGYWRYADDLFADVADVEFEALCHWMPLPAAPTENGKS